MIEINREACVGCGQCLQICVGKALKLNDGKAEYVKECLQCGQM